MKVKEFQYEGLKNAIVYLKKDEKIENLEKLKNKYNNICYIYSATDDLVNTIKSVVTKN